LKNGLTQSHSEDCDLEHNQVTASFIRHSFLLTLKNQAKNSSIGISLSD
jgi:hypothetical protein